MPTIADHIVRALVSAGVRTLFGVPGGGGNLDLIDAARGAGLPFVLTATETAAALAAVAQAELTGRPGACLTTLGPGAASVANGVACARLERAPIVVFTDCYSEAGSASFEHQRFDHRALLAGLTKLSATLTRDSAQASIEAALCAAVADPPGPVHLDCPGDVLGLDIDPQRSCRGATEVAPSERTGPPSLPEAAPPWSSSGERAEAAAFDRLLSHARRPLVIAGLGARRPEDAAAVRALVESRGVPAMVTYKAKGVIPDDHRWFAGIFTHASIEQPAIDESDLLIGMGLDPVELLPRPWRREQPIVSCGRWPAGSGHVPFAAELVTTIPAAVQRVDAALPASSWDAARVCELVEEQRRKSRPPAAGLTAQDVVIAAASRLARVAGCVTVDAGAHMFPATMLWPIVEPGGMLISNGLSTMGFALPAAIGAALVDRRCPVVALTGDGGLLMCIGELVTAVRERLRLIVIVFVDASLSLIEIKQQARRLPAAGVALGAIDWTALAASCGFQASAARDEGELGRAVESALACDGPALIAASIDRSNYAATLKAIRG